MLRWKSEFLGHGREGPAPAYNRRLELFLQVELTPEQLIEAIKELPHEDLYQLIIDVDAWEADWDFTLRLYEHFKGLKEDYDREVKELV